MASRKLTRETSDPVDGGDVVYEVSSLSPSDDPKEDDDAEVTSLDPSDDDPYATQEFLEGETFIMAFLNCLVGCVIWFRVRKHGL
jgi:hypothetical protein